MSILTGHDLFCFNQTVPAVATTVNDTRPIGLSVLENEEVMTQHIHLQNRFFRVHRLE